MADLDHAFYKVLTKTDIGKKPGQAKGSNEGGPVIPDKLVPYFPPLPDSAKATEEWPLKLELYIDETPIDVVHSRWAYQTRQRTRAREYRITRAVKTRFLNTAEPGDILVFRRYLDSANHYQVRLVQRDTSAHEALLRQVSGARWGPVAEEPTSLEVVSKDIRDIVELADSTFTLFGKPRPMQPQRRALRDAAFGRVVKRAYDHVCAACGQGYLVPVGDPTPDPISEPEAAHIVPVQLGGTDDPRNGLCLCRAHHWAFDNRLIFVDANRRWRATRGSLRENRNNVLNDIDGVRLTPPQEGFAAPAEEALSWHRERVLST